MLRTLFVINWNTLIFNFMQILLILQSGTENNNK